MRWPNTLFGRTTLVIASVSVVFQIFAIGAIAYFALVPLGLRATNDFAATLVDVARTWDQQNPAQRAEYADHVLRTYAVKVGPAGESRSGFFKVLPYYYFLERSLEQRTQREIRLQSATDEEGEKWLWANIPTPHGYVGIGFAQSRIGVYPPLALALILVAGAAATLVTSTYLARRLTAPLRRLSTAVKQVGAGRQPDLLPEDGPEEFVACVRSFNRMAGQVQELLANRTTLLAGISHDLRSPLARMRLALGMIAENPDPALVNRLMRDVDAMNTLISRCLEVGQGLDEHPVRLDLGGALGDMVNEARRDGNTIEYDAEGTCEITLRPLAFRRVVGNLLENALRYGEGKPVRVELDCSRQEIRILDRGPGIPADKRSAVFRPFFRLEPSRCAGTGGSGLGLAIVMQLVNANNWQISLDNRHGGGTVATLKLAAEQQLFLEQGYQMRENAQSIMIKFNEDGNSLPSDQDSHFIDTTK